MRPRRSQAARPNQVDGRDTFQTPNYAVDLLEPFLACIVTTNKELIWEPAAGLGKIVKRLQHYGYRVSGTDLQGYDGYKPFNFVSEYMAFSPPLKAIVTNPPFSLKQRFYRRCLEYKVPFALLIDATYSQWIIDAIRKDGAEKIIPSRRIDYITPNILKRIHEGEIWALVKKSSDNVFDNIEQARESEWWKALLKEHSKLHVYKSIYDAPAKLLKKYSSSYFHSMWLTWGFKLGTSETFVELTNAMKKNI